MHSAGLNYWAINHALFYEKGILIYFSSFLLRSSVVRIFYWYLAKALPYGIFCKMEIFLLTMNNIDS